MDGIGIATCIHCKWDVKGLNGKDMGLASGLSVPSQTGRLEILTVGMELAECIGDLALIEIQKHCNFRLSTSWRIV